MIKYLVVADETNSGQEISWRVAYSTVANDATWTTVAITQNFAVAGAVTTTGTTDIAFAANTGANAWKASAYDNALWVAATPVNPSSTIFRLTPDESTTTDARPVVGEAATAYYVATN